jgi:hypothetical protein
MVSEGLKRRPRHEACRSRRLFNNTSSSVSMLRLVAENVCSKRTHPINLERGLLVSQCLLSHSTWWRYSSAEVRLILNGKVLENGKSLADCRTPTVGERKPRPKTKIISLIVRRRRRAAAPCLPYEVSSVRVEVNVSISRA